MAFWKTTSYHLLRTLLGCTWVPLVSTSSELMALLDIFLLQREMSLMCFSSAAFSFLGWPLHLRSSWLAFFLCFFEELEQHILKPQSAAKIFVWERLCWCSINTLCLSLAMVYELWNETVFHNLTEDGLVDLGVWSFKPPTQLFLFQWMTVFQPPCEIDD